LQEIKQNYLSELPKKDKRNTMTRRSKIKIYKLEIQSLSTEA
jgi:hypothetical protein